MTRLFVTACGVMMLVVGSLAGCQRGPAVGTVEGEVTLDGQPLKEGRIALTPLDGQSQTAGATITDGKFALEAPATSMKVEINANRVIGKRRVYEDSPQSPVVDVVEELIPPRYNINSELTLEVKPGPQQAKFELKSK
jgi:hypothetical protein